MARLFLRSLVVVALLSTACHAQTLIGVSVDMTIAQIQLGNHVPVVFDINYEVRSFIGWNRDTDSFLSNQPNANEWSLMWLDLPFAEGNSVTANVWGSFSYLDSEGVLRHASFDEYVEETNVSRVHGCTIYVLPFLTIETPPQ